MVEEYLTLLREALDQVINMHKTCDPSVADYVLQLETAAQFIYKALKTEDRLDIFRALQKAHDVLEKEYDETPEDEEYDNLVDRLEKALQGLQEEVFIRKGLLKGLTKVVLREIYMKPNSGGGKRHPFFSFIDTVSQALKSQHPAINNINEGQKTANKMLETVINDIKLLREAAEKKEYKEFKKLNNLFYHHRETLLRFLVNWARQIFGEFHETGDKIDRVMDEVGHHFVEISNQGNTAFRSLKDYKNYINALKEFEHLNEIFDATKESINKLFKIGISAGFGNKKKI